MAAKVTLVILIYLGWLPSSTPDTSDLAALLPNLSFLCPGVEFCGKDPLTNGNATPKVNPCCRGCSCDDTCYEANNCCFAENYNWTSRTECLVPGTAQEVRNARKYLFVVDSPNGGCLDSVSDGQHENASCSSLEKVAPWGNFFPVYSKMADKNFKNAACARCHGVVDGQEWSAVFEYTGRLQGLLDSVTLFNEKGILLNSRIFFMPPNAESKSFDKLCFDEKGTCPEIFRDKFYIPSKLQMDRQSVIEACEIGPRAMYIRMIHKAYKNIFCAICNGAAIAIDDAVRCEFDPEEARFTDSPYRSLLDVKSIEDATQIAARNEDNGRPCFRSKHHKNDSNCHHTFCPVLQTRLHTGGCGFTTQQTTVNCMNVCLNLSTSQDTKEDKQLLLDMPDSQILSIVERNSPWAGVFSVYTIAYLEETSDLEFLVCMVLKRNQLKLQEFVEYFQTQLSKTWSLDIKRRIEFRQKISRHGSTTRGSDHDSVTPLWSRYEYPANISLIIPSWRRVYDIVALQPTRFCLGVTKTMLCDQIELPKDEYQLDSRNSVLYLTEEERVLYPNEFVTLVDKDGSLRVRVCLKDSGYVKQENQSNSVSTWKATVTVMIVIMVTGQFHGMFKDTNGGFLGESTE